MADEMASEVARGGLELLAELAPDLRGAAVLGRDGDVLAASGNAAHWRDAAAALLAAADSSGEHRAEAVHVGTEGGEAFALRHEGLVAVAVTERFALASLTLFDLRALLREVALATEGTG